MALADDTKNFGALPQAEAWSEIPAHEKSDVNLRMVGTVLALLAAGAVVIHAALWRWVNTPERGKFDEEATRPAIAAPPDLARRSFPQLQLSPARDLQEFLAREEQRLHGAGPAQRTNRLEQLSIERAMAIVAQRGVPNWRDGAPSISPLELQRQRSAEPEKDVR